MTYSNPRAPSADVAAPHWVHAEIRIGERDTRYRRAGTGRTLVALSRHPDLPFLRHCDALAREARVIAPVMPDATPAECATWLAGLLDGFDIDATTLVADETAALVALALARAWPGRVLAVRLLFPPAMAGCILVDEYAADGT
ncbi:MAG TPA: hypothetical protein VFY20_08260 [Gemmatimonadales bacterium]|nr:hypothetical protein [Gemmatimonadales bacterium]